MYGFGATYYVPGKLNGLFSFFDFVSFFLFLVLVSISSATSEQRAPLFQLVRLVSSGLGCAIVQPFLITNYFTVSTVIYVLSPLLHIDPYLIFK